MMTVNKIMMRFITVYTCGCAHLSAHSVLLQGGVMCPRMVRLHDTFYILQDVFVLTTMMTTIIMRFKTAYTILW